MRVVLFVAVVFLSSCAEDIPLKDRVIHKKTRFDYWGHQLPNNMCRFISIVDTHGNYSEIIDSCSCYEIGDPIIKRSK